MLRILFLLSAVVLVIFSVTNSQKVTLSLWPFPYEMISPLSFLIFIVFVLGFFVGFLSKSIASLFSKKSSTEKDKK